MDKTTTFDADTMQLVHRFRSTKEKIKRTSRHIAFNHFCLKQNITPNYAKINLKNTSYPAKQTKQTAEKLFIKNNIKHLYHQKNIHNQTAYTLHQKLARKLHHTRTVKHWKWCPWHRKASAKTQVSLTRFLQSEVKIIHIIEQNNTYYSAK